MMLRSIAFSLLLTVSLGGVPASAAAPVFPLGSHIGFVPPPGFVVSKRFPGFEDPASRASMVLATLPAQAYDGLERQISPEILKKQGFAEAKRERLTFADGKGVVVIGTEQAKGIGKDKGKVLKIRKFMLLAQLKEGLALVAVILPEAGTGAKSTTTDNMVLASLKTMAVRVSVPIQEQMALMPFKLNNFSGLHPVRVFGTTGVVLTYGSKPAAPPTDQPFFAVQIAPGGPEQPPDRGSFARNLFTNLGDMKEPRIVSGDMLKLGSGPTYELQADAKEAFTDTPMKLVQWVRFGNGSYIRMLGMARADQWATAFPHFRAVRDGVVPHVE